MDFLEHLIDAPIANILIVAGVIFLGIAAIGKITGKVEPDKTGRIMSGLLGVILILAGAYSHVQRDKPPSPLQKSGEQTEPTSGDSKQPADSTKDARSKKDQPKQPTDSAKEPQPKKHQGVQKEVKPPAVVPGPSKTQVYVVPGANVSFVENNGHLVSTADGSPLCPTPPGWHTGCRPMEPNYRQNWRNTPDGYLANGKKVKTFSNRGERIFEILGTKRAFYVDDGHLYDYVTGTILCPWPKAGVAPCQAIEAQYENRWRNTPNGFIADGHEFNADEVMRQVRQGLF